MPRIESRTQKTYVGKRQVMRLSDLEKKVPEALAQLCDWLGKHGVEPTGPSFVRYHVIDMPDRIDAEAAISLDAPLAAAAGIEHHSLPPGRYAISTFIGIRNGIAANQTVVGIAANQTLVQWIADQGEAMAMHQSAQGEAFESRYETLLTDPESEPDTARWETEVAIKLRG